VRGFTAEARALLRRYPWPGNVRELRNEVLRMVALADGDMLGPELTSPALRAPRPARSRCGGTLTLKERVEEFEAGIIADALTRHGGNISRAADELGLSRVGLRGKMARYGLEKHVPVQPEPAQ